MVGSVEYRNGRPCAGTAPKPSPSVVYFCLLPSPNSCSRTRPRPRCETLANAHGCIGYVASLMRTLMSVTYQNIGLSRCNTNMHKHAGVCITSSPGLKPKSGCTACIQGFSDQGTCPPDPNRSWHQPCLHVLAAPL